jgi:ferrous iron transport protein B
MIAPLMTCSARLPVYALLIAAFIPDREVGHLFNLQGLVLFVLYFAGIISAMAVAWCMKRTMGSKRKHALMLELPNYHLPNLRNLAIGLWERAKIFLMRVGTLILTLTILLWALSSFPGAPEGATQPPIYYSLAGMIGRALEFVFAPIGFNWQICIALVPGMAAREVAVGALGTVYALSQSGDEVATALAPVIASTWSMATALSLLAWYVYAPQCLATLSVVKRETGQTRYALLMAGYMFALAYTASFIVYHSRPPAGGMRSPIMWQELIVALIVMPPVPAGLQEVPAGRAAAADGLRAVEKGLRPGQAGEAVQGTEGAAAAAAVRAVRATPRPAPARHLEHTAAPSGA